MGLYPKFKYMTFIYSQPLMGLSLGLVGGGGGSSPVVAGVLLPNLKRFGNNSHQEQKIDTELCGYSFYSNSSD